MLALVALPSTAACTSSEPVHADASAAQSASATPESSPLIIRVHDKMPFEMSVHQGDVCYPTALTKGAAALGAEPADIIVKDAAGVIVGTTKLDTTAGQWTGEECTLIVSPGNVKPSNFYTVEITGQSGVVRLEPFSKTETVKPTSGEGQSASDATRYVDVDI